MNVLSPEGIRLKGCKTGDLSFAQLSIENASPSRLEIKGLGNFGKLKSSLGIVYVP